MMAKRTQYGYAKGEGWQTVTLPYEGGRLAMTALLPDRGNFTAIETQLTLDTLTTFNKGFRSTEMILELPRWKTDSAVALPEVLQKMGVEAAFSSNWADLSGINGGNDLYVSDARHRAVIEVNEEGTEASAATAVVITTRSMKPQPEPPRVTFDRPFFYWIYDQPTGIILFIGRQVQ
jgi:serpin B